jgi:hypothetical protein
MEIRYPYDPVERGYIYQEVRQLVADDECGQFRLTAEKYAGTLAIEAAATAGSAFAAEVGNMHDIALATAATGGGVVAITAGMLAGFVASRGSRRKQAHDKGDTIANRIIANEFTLDQYMQNYSNRVQQDKEQDNEQLKRAMQGMGKLGSRVIYAPACLGGVVASLFGAQYIIELGNDSSQQMLNETIHNGTSCALGSAAFAGIGYGFKRLCNYIGKKSFAEKPSSQDPQDPEA